MVTVQQSEATCILSIGHLLIILYTEEGMGFYENKYGASVKYRKNVKISPI